MKDLLWISTTTTAMNKMRAWYPYAVLVVLHQDREERGLTSKKGD